MSRFFPDIDDKDMDFVSELPCYKWRIGIVETLIAIGVPDDDNKIAVIARLIEILAAAPRLTLERAVEDFASKHGTSVNSITYIIEKCFNVYDPKTVAAVSAVTDSHPLTAKDILSDLSVYFRKKLRISD